MLHLGNTTLGSPPHENLCERVCWSLPSDNSLWSSGSPWTRGHWFRCLKKTLLRRRGPLEILAWKTPNQGWRAVSAAVLQGKGSCKRSHRHRLLSFHVTVCSAFPCTFSGLSRQVSGSLRLRTVSWKTNLASESVVHCPRTTYCVRWPDHQGDLHIRESRMLAPVRPRKQAAGLQCLKLQIAVASPDPQTRVFPSTQLSWKIRSPKLNPMYIYMIYVNVCSVYVCMYVYIYIYTHLYIHTHIHMYRNISYTYSIGPQMGAAKWLQGTRFFAAASRRFAFGRELPVFSALSDHWHHTPGLHNKIPPHKIFARVWVAQEPICS